MKKKGRISCQMGSTHSWVHAVSGGTNKAQIQNYETKVNDHDTMSRVAIFGFSIMKSCLLTVTSIQFNMLQLTISICYFMSNIYYTYFILCYKNIYYIECYVHSQYAVS